MLHNRAQKSRLQVLPFGRALGTGHGDEIATEKYARNALDLEQPHGQWRARGGGGIGKIGDPVAEHRPPRQKFQGRRIGRRFGLDKHE